MLKDVPRRLLTLGLAAFAPLACTVTRPGTLTDLASGVTLPGTVSVTSDSAWVRAVDPRTGEVLQGRLSLDPARRHSRPPLPPESPLPSGSGGLGAAGAGVPLRGGTLLHLAGELEGDRGTRLHCTIQVEQRLHLRGTGFCYRAEGGVGRGLRLQF